LTVLTPFDDYPIHQTAEPLTNAGGGHPNQYDRYFFNGYTESLYFALAFGLYPNRGIMDAAFAVVHDGVQRSVFASGRIPLDRTRTSIGPISLEIVEPLRLNRIRVDAAEHGLTADLLARARTPVCEEARVTRYQETTLLMDRTRATQMLTWSGELTVGGTPVPLPAPVYGTKDRSWGMRGLGDPIPAAPPRTRQHNGSLFLWAPINFADRCLHYVVHEDENGRAWSQTALELPVIGADDPVWGPDIAIGQLDSVRHRLRWAPGTRRSAGGTLVLGPDDAVELEPLLSFRMKGIGYQHPVWGHGRWHDELAVTGETHTVAELDTLTPDCIHVQQVVRATRGVDAGLGVLEQAVYGPYRPGGFQQWLDGAPSTGSPSEWSPLRKSE
jgi:hypothetical protein